LIIAVFYDILLLAKDYIRNLELKKEREKLGNFGVLEKIANYLLKK